MNAKISRSLIIYGVFCQIVGGIGYASNPKAAISALISGTAACVLSVLFGLLARSGKKWPLIAGTVTTTIFLVAFTIRATKGWKAYSEGDHDKLLAASLVTALALASFFLVARLIVALRKPASEA